VTSLVTLEDLLDPGNDLMRGRIARLVKVDNTVLLQHINGASRGRITAGKGSKVSSFDVQFVEVLKWSEKKGEGRVSTLKFLMSDVYGAQSHSHHF
jgi:hypothetical protein